MVISDSAISLLATQLCTSTPPCLLNSLRGGSGPRLSLSNLHMRHYSDPLYQHALESKLLFLGPYRLIQLDNKQKRLRASHTFHLYFLQRSQIKNANLAITCTRIIVVIMNVNNYGKQQNLCKHAASLSALWISLLPRSQRSACSLTTSRLLKRAD